MRYFRLIPIALTAALSCSSVLAQAPEQPPTGGSTVAAAAPMAATKPVDPLFEALKRERDPQKARGIASQIFSDLNDSGSATVNLLMQWATTAMKEKRNGAALDFLDQVTMLDPAYPEGWQRRATLHYTMGETRKSMADIAEVLRREPRHLGALAGMAGILTEAGKDELALKAWERYLEVYPADRDAQEAVTKLTEKIAGSRT
jgi:tetratricopeptide (TPR) repeat protein